MAFAVCEIRMGADLIMLATPELGGMPYVLSGLVAAGGLAAALSTADGLLLTISNALVRDLYFQERQRLDTRKRRISPEQRVILSKFALLLVALSAALWRRGALRHSSHGLGLLLSGGLGFCAGHGAGHLLAAPRAVVRWPACCWAWP
jgi:Na+/proline symporter